MKEEEGSEEPNNNETVSVSKEKDNTKDSKTS